MRQRILSWFSAVLLICFSSMSLPLQAKQTSESSKTELNHTLAGKSETKADSTAPATSGDSRDFKLDNGFYLVLRKDEDRAKVVPIKEGEKFLVNDYHFLDPEERDKTQYVVLQKSPFVPIILSSDPAKDIDERGRPRLKIEFAKEQVLPLEEFSSKNLGQTVAIVIGGEIVTMHKIKEPIKGGKIQITRCTDNGCEKIYAELQKDRK